MSVFRRGKPVRFNPAEQEPVVRKSICTGEMTVGLIDRHTGKFQDLMRVDSQKELDAF